MIIRKALFIFLIFFKAGAGYALQPNQILVIANSDIQASMQIAQYYCTKRAVPEENILALPLGASLSDRISRADYDEKIAQPIRQKLSTDEFAGKVRCLLTVYGVPIKVGRRPPLKDQQGTLEQLEKLADQLKNKMEQLQQISSPASDAQQKIISRKLARLQWQIDYIVGKETEASVDSELSMVLSGSYQLYRWQPNRIKTMAPYWDFKTLIVSRLDGPSWQIAEGLVDKAMIAEKNGLKGIAYIDSGYSQKNAKPLFVKYDMSLRDLATIIRTQTSMPVIEERTSELFEPGQCPFTAIYCGWYSVKTYINAFDFVDGAVGYHIASYEAMDLRDPNSSQWCPAMLRDGVTATLGAVAEPYLQAFPYPKDFFQELFDGQCLVEAYYLTKPFNSWQLVLIGDPLYRPFNKIPAINLERGLSTPLNK
jgi:uncharacterized protein (TIGR03790 family)